MKKWCHTTKIKIWLLAKLHVIIIVLTLCGGIIGKILRSDLFRIIAGFYFIFGNVLYVFIFNVLNEKKITVTKTTSGFHNKVYYFANTITSLIIVLIIISFLQWQKES